MDAGSIELEGELRAGDAAGLRDRLRAALEAGDVQVGTAGLTAADCATVQVLISAKRSALQLDRNLQIDSPDGGALALMLDRLALRAALAG
jgi:anti-anti-sigma regulatory factor